MADLKYIDEIDFRLLEAQRKTATALALSESHSNVRQALQSALTSEHRSSYDESGGYDDYPQVADVFGDHMSGNVVYRHQGGHYKAPYTRDTDNGEEGADASYTVGEPSAVEPAYVDRECGMNEAYTEAALNPAQITVLERYISQKTRSQMSKEDFAGKGTSFPIKTPGDVIAALHSIGRAGAGNDSPAVIKSRIIEIAKRKGFKIPKSDQKESFHEAGLEGSIVPLREAFLDKDGNGEVCVITAGVGQDGVYSVDVLKKAVDAGVFREGTHMHLDHQTEKEAAERPEKSMKTLAAKFTNGGGKFKENGSEGPGVYSPIHAYPEYIDFLNARGGDTGVSIDARGRRGSDVVHNGRNVPQVESLVLLKSADFVTKAGRGGKLLPLYESFRESHRGGERDDPMANVTIDEKELATLRESAAKVPALQLATDRTNDRLNRYDARDFVGERLKESGLPAVAQTRLAKSILAPEATIPVKESGAIDFDKLTATIKSAVESEITYLRESGVRLGPVRLPGADAPKDTAHPDEATLKESDKLMDDEIGKLYKASNPGVKSTTKGAA